MGLKDLNLIDTLELLKKYDATRSEVVREAPVLGVFKVAIADHPGFVCEKQYWQSNAWGRLYVVKGILEPAAGDYYALMQCVDEGSDELTPQVGKMIKVRIVMSANDIMDNLLSNYTYMGNHEEPTEEYDSDWDLA